MLTRNRIIVFLLATAALTLTGAAPAFASGSGSALVGSAPVGNGPGVVAVNPATDTIYVSNGNNPDGASAGGNTVSVIDARHCNARDVSRCKGPWPTITVGNLPTGIAIDQATDTVYVSNAADNTVSVFNGATCNALDHAGCNQTPATVPVGTSPIMMTDDPLNHTVYVGTVGATGTGTEVSMIDTATCNAADLSECPHTAAPTVDVGSTPQSIAIDPATHTAYVTTYGPLNGWTVFDTNTCNASDQAGCADLGHLTGDPVGPSDAQVDTANDTLYTANFDNTASAFDLADCNAADLAGCSTVTPGIVTPFPESGFETSFWLTVDQENHSVYVVYQKDDALMVIDADACNGANPAGCAALTPREIHTGNDPVGVALDDGTQTLYTVDPLGNEVSVIDASRCDAETTTGCRQVAPTAAIPGAGAAAADGLVNTIQGAGDLAADPEVNTTYVTNGAGTVSMINTSSCNAHDSAGCSATPPATSAGTNPSGVAIDAATHTVYVTDQGSGATGTVTAFDDRTCNAHDQAGCATTRTLQVPDGNPTGLAINPVTDTLYVATLTSNGGANLISVFNGATCNAANGSGCNQTPANTPTGNDGGGVPNAGEGVAVNPATNTIYAISDTFGNPFDGHSVYVIEGATCDAADTTGCGNTPALVDLGMDPFFGATNPLGIAVDQATDTIYAANIFNGEGPGTVSVINGAICNGQDLDGCGQTPAVAPAGFGANGVAVDQTTNQVYVTNIEDTSVTTIDGDTCNGTHAAGCSDTQTDPITDDYPSAISVDPAVSTAYVLTLEGVSVIPLSH